MIDNNSYFTVNTVVIGDSKAGKTSILNNLLHNEFRNDIDTTLGVNYNIKVIKLTNHKVNFKIWDTAGLKKFRAIGRSYYKSADIVLLVFDLTKMANFYSKLKNWIQDVRSLNKNAVIYLIGNKSDLDRKISSIDCKNFANKYNIIYYECSAKYSNIEELFLSIANDLYLKNKLNKKKIIKSISNKIEYTYLELDDSDQEEEKTSCLEKLNFFRCI